MTTQIEVRLKEEKKESLLEFQIYFIMNKIPTLKLRNLNEMHSKIYEN